MTYHVLNWRAVMKTFFSRMAYHVLNRRAGLKTFFKDDISCFKLKSRHENLFYRVKTLDCFQDNVRFIIFEHILNLNLCRLFETKPTFPFFNIIRFSKQSSLSWITKYITESVTYLMQTKLTSKLLINLFSPIFLLKNE